MDREEFETVVEEALASLPADFARHLENVGVLIEDEPAPELLRSLGLNPRRDTLFGLYNGTPLTERGASFANALPDTITIYYRPLTRSFRTRARLRREIRDTVLHEIGHYFGLDEEALRELGY